MNYKTCEDIYHHMRESYIKNLYENAREIYRKVIEKSKKSLASHLGDYNGGGSLSEYMRKTPSQNFITEEITINKNNDNA